MFAIWIVQLLIAFLIYRDAKEQKMLTSVWVILALLPMFGYLVDVPLSDNPGAHVFQENRKTTCIVIKKNPWISLHHMVW